MSFTEDLYGQVRRHLFPGDGREASAILLCSRVPDPRVRLLTRGVVLVPHTACTVRESDRLTWPGSFIEDAIDRAIEEELSLVLIHSHPGGMLAFSAADDMSDHEVLPCIFHALGPLHGTAVMVPSGAVLARVYDRQMQQISIDLTSVCGHDFLWFWSDGRFAVRPMAFSSDMTTELAKLTTCVVGVSGTGSIVAEQLARLGVGRVLLIDHDVLESRNLNRILNSTIYGARSALLKVDAFAEAINTYRAPGVPVPLSASITDREAVMLASQADLIFSCVDTLEARYFLDLIASSFLMPLFDVGVAIPTRKVGGGVAIADVCGRIDYVKPGGATLRDRSVYTPASLRDEYLRKVAPEAHYAELTAGYIKGVPEEAPSVISLNMRAASACVMEFIARAYPFRHASNEHYARTEFSLAASEEEYHAEASFLRTHNPHLARGRSEPLLGLPALQLQIDK